jgi:hypothetical protein
VALSHRLRYARSHAERRVSRRRLLSKLPRDGVGAEIGTWKGDFSEQLLRHARPRLLYLVDPWEFRDDPQYTHGMFGSDDQGNQASMDAIHDEVRRRFDDEIAAGKVAVMRSRSTDAAAGMDALDWIYIDGDHTYEGVKGDLEAFYPLVRQGGAIAGDDYAVVGWWGDAVIRAVDEFVASHGCELVIIGHQFLFRKP